jgi:uncharacterized membrane protein
MALRMGALYDALRAMNFKWGPQEERRTDEMTKREVSPVEKARTLGEILGDVVAYLVLVGIPIFLLYFLVRFVKWAWTN